MEIARIRERGIGIAIEHRGTLHDLFRLESAALGNLQLEKRALHVDRWPR
jgi:hypothetical protein